MGVAISKYRERKISAVISKKLPRRNALILTVIFAIYLAIFSEYSLVVNATLLLSWFSFWNFLFALGRIIPVKELTGLLMVVQLLLMPYLDYYTLRPMGVTSMAVNEETYFNFAFPAVIAFYLGIYIPMKKKNIDFTNLLNFPKEDKKKYGRIGICLILIGYLFTILGRLITLPGFEFFLTVLRFFSFVGLFYFMFSGSKYTILVILAVIIPSTISTIKSTVFIDLIVLLFFLYAFVAIKLRIKPIISFLLIVGISFILIILQSVKMQYRSESWSDRNVAMEKQGVSRFTDLFASKLTGLSSETYLLMQLNIINRMNQGWIVSRVIKKFPANSIEGGKNFFYNELLGIFLPRFIFPDKPVVGDNAKFRYLTGLPLVKTVAMNVGILGDGYGNFNYRGGILFCFLFGLLINIAINYFYRLVFKTPSLIFWMPLLFFYLMRAGNEFYIIANWTVKVAIIVATYFYISKRIFGKAI